MSDLNTETGNYTFVTINHITKYFPVLTLYHSLEKHYELNGCLMVILKYIKYTRVTILHFIENMYKFLQQGNQ